MISSRYLTNIPPSHPHQSHYHPSHPSPFVSHLQPVVGPVLSLLDLCLFQDRVGDSDGSVQLCEHRGQLGEGDGVVMVKLLHASQVEDLAQHPHVSMLHWGGEEEGRELQ